MTVHRSTWNTSVASARLLQSRNECNMIIIDYLQLCDMTTGQNNRNREQEVAQATRKAKLLAKELNVPVVLLSQLNRVSEGRPAGRPELSQLRESGAIEQDADVVLLLYRPCPCTHDRPTAKAVIPPKDWAVVIIAKQRNGETGNVYFRHNPEMTKITDYVPPLEYMLKHAKVRSRFQREIDIQFYITTYSYQSFVPCFISLIQYKINSKILDFLLSDFVYL